MASFTINSRKFGAQVFTCQSSRSYVRCNGKQICDGGKLLGNTISATEKTLEHIAKKWWKQYLKNQREFG